MQLLLAVLGPGLVSKRMISGPSQPADLSHTMYTVTYFLRSSGKEDHTFNDVAPTEMLTGNGGWEMSLGGPGHGAMVKGSMPPIV